MIKSILGFFGIGRSLENPATPLSDPSAWLVDLFGGGVSSSGIRVNESTAKTLSTVWRAINLISRDVAKLPLEIYRNEADGDRNRDRSHKAYRLLKRRATIGINAYQFRMTLTARALLSGNGYALIRRNNNGEPRELVPFDERTIYPVVEKSLASGERKLHYHATIGSESFILPAESVLHIRGLGDGYLGESVVGWAMDSIGEGIAAQRYGSTTFKNGARPSVVLEHPARLSKEAIDDLRKSWDKTYSGTENTGKTAILQEGMTLKPFSMPAADVEFLATREFKVRDIANWFGVPPHKLGDTERTSFASLEQENQSYLDDALDPWLVNWEAELYEKLLTEVQQQRESHTIEFTRNALVRANLEARGNFYNLGVMGGWLSRDEIRHRENMNRIPDGTGGDFLVPLNMAGPGDDGDQGGDGDPPPDDDGQGEDDGRSVVVATDRVLRENVSRMVARIGRQADRAAKNPADFLRWVDRIDEMNRKVVGDNFESTLAACSAARGRGSEPVDASLDEFFRSVTDAYLLAAEVKPAGLAVSVAEATRKLEVELPDSIMEAIWNADD